MKYFIVSKIYSPLARLITSLFFCLFFLSGFFFIKDSYSEDVQKGFEEAMKNIEAAKLKEGERITEELKSKFMVIEQVWLNEERKKRQAYLGKYIEQEWEKSTVSGPYLHQNYYLRDISYNEVKSDITKTDSVLAPYAAVLRVVENFYVEKEHSSSTSNRRDFFYTARTAAVINFEYKSGTFVVVDTSYGKAVVTKGWPEEVVSNLRLL